MPDSRFYTDLGPVSLSALAEVAGAEIVAADQKWAGRMIEAAAPLAHARDVDVAFFGDRRYGPALRDTAAGACFLRPDHLGLAPETCAKLVAAEPHAAWARAALRLHRPRQHPADEPAMHPSAELEEGVAFGPGVVIGPDARIGAGTVIGANAVIGPGVAIGRDCRIGANATVLFALLGDRVRVLSGAVIGEAGFGVAGAASAVIDVPQLGRVIIQDDVTIGANTCIDRGAWDDTVVGEGTKIDNLVQIAHNVRLGRFCLLAAHTGISGSVTVGDGAVFGGRAGIADHLDIGAGARIAAAAGVMKDVPAGEMWVGSPARPIRRFMRETAWLARQAKGPSGGGSGSAARGQGRDDGDQ